MSKTGRIPERLCIGCGQMKPKTQLLRIAKDENGEIKVDKNFKIQGRGAYICLNRDCLKNAQKRRGLERSFKQKLEAALYDFISEVIENELAKNS